MFHVSFICIWFVWISLIYIQITNAEWTLSQSFPRIINQLAVGAYNNTIFLIGGFFNTDITRYEVDTDTFTDIGDINSDIGTNSQYWTQLDHIIYVIAGSNALNVYDMIALEYTENWESMRFPIDADAGCLASNSEYLFITGGQYSFADAHNELQILNLTALIWLFTPPSMLQEREEHACVVHNDYLWVFGGNSDYSAPLSTNERIFTIDITQNIWNNIGELTVAESGLRSVSWFNFIYIIGGFNTIVHLVDADTGTVTTSSDVLPLRNWWGSPVIVDATFYIFGGFYDAVGVGTNECAYYPLPTPPTSNPSSPSKDPTAIPSFHPTAVPSSDPTLAPSNDPTISITLDPSSSPTNDATVSPSDNPSSLYYTTTIATINPTIIPTKHPSINPISNVPLYPTSNPSFFPSVSSTFEMRTLETFYTVSIVINECKNDEDDCDINKDKINNILIAHIDDVTILRTDIIDNTVSVIISIEAQDENVLDTDTIANDIEHELEVEYGDVDVTIEKKETEKQNMFSTLTVVIGIVVIALVIVGAIVFALYRYFGNGKTHKYQQNMVEMEAQQHVSNVVQKDVFVCSDNISEIVTSQPGAMTHDVVTSEGVSDDIKTNKNATKPAPNPYETNNIKDDEFVVIGDDEEHHNTVGNDVNIGNDEFIVKGDDEMGETTF